MTYISEDKRCKEEYICSKLLVNDDVKEQLLRGGMDQRLATHFAHIMSRDPVYLSQTDISDVNVGDANILDAFQSGVWQHVRLKMPPPDSSDIGWRVEFRPMEVQPRDSENAAFVIFMFLLSRAIIAFDLDFYIPIDKVTESMDAAHKRHAVLSERLWFRKEGWSSERFCSTMCFRQGQTCLCGTSAIARRDSGISVSQDPEYALMSVDKIINGEGESEPVGRAKFPGLIPIILAYLELSGISQNQMIRLSPYLDLVSKRASTQLPTPAHWIRSFVKRHPKYQRDSVVHQEICYDLMKEIVHLGSD
jgi:glutamate--cysteine ligase catalytic subunit